MVVGDQHRKAGRLGRGHAVETGNAVVHGDQQLRALLQRHRDDLRGQAVAVLEAVGHQVVDMRRAEHAQRQHAHRTGGGAVGIEVADDDHALALLQRRHQQLDRRIDALQLAIRDQPRQRLVQLGGGLHAAGGIQAGQQGRQVAEIRQDGRQGAGNDMHRGFASGLSKGQTDHSEVAARAAWS
ncbi:hypothetical protein D3C80_1009700 [compost metagenome]